MKNYSNHNQTLDCNQNSNSGSNDDDKRKIDKEI